MSELVGDIQVWQFNQSPTMKILINIVGTLAAAYALSACSMGPQITRTQDVSESADTPYQDILVIALFAKFDTRRRLEKEVVEQLSELGTNAVASTSLMDTSR